ncbi:MAG: hypothetical protein M5U34_02730 [Chloroflexi bacterium]|nr:hypothetical protein [Chloroflexota bacterium]
MAIGAILKFYFQGVGIVTFHTGIEFVYMGIPAAVFLASELVSALHVAAEQSSAGRKVMDILEAETFTQFIVACLTSDSIYTGCGRASLMTVDAGIALQTRNIGLIESPW